MGTNLWCCCGGFGDRARRPGLGGMDGEVRQPRRDELRRQQHRWRQREGSGGQPVVAGGVAISSAGADGPVISLALWGQYVLDNFAAVAEAVAALTATLLWVVTAQVPGEQRMATMHLAMSDPDRRQRHRGRPSTASRPSTTDVNSR